MDFVAVLEDRCPGQIKVMDIGGGLSTTYTEPEEPEEFSYQKYREQLNIQVDIVFVSSKHNDVGQVPELFSGSYKIVTEMGRSLFLKSGTSLTRVEYVKDWVPEQNPILLTHLGTNQFPRSAYLPHIWRHRFSIFTPQGRRKVRRWSRENLSKYLTFAGGR